MIVLQLLIILLFNCDFYTKYCFTESKIYY